MILGIYIVCGKEEKVGNVSLVIFFHERGSCKKALVTLEF